MFLSFQPTKIFEIEIGENWGELTEGMTVPIFCWILDKIIVILFWRFPKSMRTLRITQKIEPIKGNVIQKKFSWNWKPAIFPFFLRKKLFWNTSRWYLFNFDSARWDYYKHFCSSFSSRDRPRTLDSGLFWNRPMQKEFEKKEVVESSSYDVMETHERRFGWWYIFNFIKCAFLIHEHAKPSSNAFQK